MANNRLVDRRTLGVAEAQLARVAAEGVAGHAHLAALLDGGSPHAARNLADAIHLLCNLYGRHPGLIDMALGLSSSGPVNDWLQEAADAFRARAAVRRPPDLRGRPLAEHAGRRRDRSGLVSPAARDRNAGQVRTARLRAWRGDRVRRRLARRAATARSRGGAGRGRMPGAGPARR